jgi:hypothetical protein
MSIGDDKREKSTTVSIGGERKTETLYLQRKKEELCLCCYCFLSSSFGTKLKIEGDG